ncbi:hypothetical protein Theco_4103 (plasmid) [Thermobacillus composti KWC4]|mgnify:CR=1 FL=1|jgi:hypothetical protein|uniref:Uncharacterized protein n=1 Tax=Thermobacillus composti (strain DSM 18247 / JCM 13945 / KWC4) TaxID=717605 RepID=L0ELD0_THECK|nr:hypothetical protein [Thermobacillus composti]AGA60100.1 hypothetical protein Theco_4103 [Thermobacillus composti KWC4]
MSAQFHEQQLQNPEIAEKIEWMKQRLKLETNEELFSKALSLLYQAIQLEDRGYTVGAFTKPGPLGDRELIEYQIVPKK